MKKVSVFIVLLVLFFGCQRYIPTFVVPKKTAETVDTEVVQEAESYFFDNFYAGNYDSIPSIIEKLTNAYFQHKNDWRLAAHLAWTHIWAISESNYYGKSNTATITNHLILSRKYFQEAWELNPDDARLLGFLGSVTLNEGGVDGNIRTVVKGMNLLEKSIAQYPEFNYFTTAYTLSFSPRPQDRVRSMNYFWKNLDLCVGEKIDQENPDYSKYMGQAVQNGKKRVCWNTDLVPHNLEGFFLILGDQLVERGKYEVAIKMYKNAYLPQEFADWPFRQLLEDRIIAVEKAMAAQATIGSVELAAVPGCMLCHQYGKGERLTALNGYDN